ncbi:hypothetical protein [Hydrocoleum sp. CS-953]|nr:hypothetical protein [Hydrocoleum sp. CS-953]
MTIHLLWWSASGNVLTIALYAIVENFDHSSPRTIRRNASFLDVSFN